MASRASCCRRDAALFPTSTRPWAPVFESRYGHDFSRDRIHTERSESKNPALEDDSIHRPQIEEFRRREVELGSPAATEMSDAAIKYRGLAASCPGRTGVDRVVDMTPAGLRGGFLTAYGAMTVMRVHPGERTWEHAF
ncbi:MAG: hypothetical protein ACREJU_02625, partial [Nitrospiraceae bacterium]